MTWEKQLYKYTGNIITAIYSVSAIEKPNVMIGEHCTKGNTLEGCVIGQAEAESLCKVSLHGSIMWNHVCTVYFSSS